MKFSPFTTLQQIQAWLRQHADTGVDCPACTQRVQVYRRKVNSGMARSLIAMYTVGGRDWIHLPTQIGARSREEGKLAYWGLVEEEKTKRPDGGRAGYWRVTARGEEFVKCRLSIPKYARVYNGRVLGFDTTTLVTIKDALGDKFDYAELMAGR
jgi:hypothetical protein